MADKYLICIEKALRDVKGYGKVRLNAAKESYGRYAEGNLERGMGLNNARAAAMDQVLKDFDNAAKAKEAKIVATAKVLGDAQAILEQSQTISTFLGTAASKIYQGLKGMVEFDPRLPTSNKNFVAVRETATRNMFRMFHDFMNEQSKNWLGVKRGSVADEDFVSEVINPGSTQSHVAKSWAKAYNQRNDYYHANIRTKGVSIRRVDGEVEWLPVAAKLESVENIQNFIDFMMPRIDWNKTGAGYFIKSNERVAWLKNYHEAAKTGLWDKMQRPNEFTGGDFAIQFHNHRMIQFKSGKAYMEAHTRYMDGGFIQTFTKSTEALGHSIAAATIWGPSVSHTQQAIANMAERMAKAATTKGNPKAIEKYLRQYKIITDMVMHKNPMDPESYLGMFSNAISNFNVASMLGGSSFLSIPGDLGNLIVNRLINHEPIHDAVNLWMKAMINAKTTRREMLLSGHTASEFQNQTWHETRYHNTGQYGAEWLQYAADKTLRLSGVQRGFDAAVGADNMARAKSLFEQRGSAFEQLREFEVLKRNGFTEAEWKTTQQAMKARPSYSPASDVYMFRPWDHEATLGSDLTHKWMRAFYNESRRSVYEASIEARAWFTGGARADTLAGVFGSLAGKFHYYPTTMFFNISRSIMAADTLAPKLRIVAANAMVLIPVAAMALQARTYWQGKEPADMTSGAFWVKATLSSGIFGYLGDITAGGLRADPGTAIMQTLAGPYGNMVADALDLTLGTAFQAMDLSETNAKFALSKKGVHLVDFFRRNLIPQPFFIQPLLQRHILEPLQEQMDYQLMKTRYKRQKTFAKEAGTPFREGYAPGDRGPIVPGF